MYELIDVSCGNKAQPTAMHTLRAVFQLSRTVQHDVDGVQCYHQLDSSSYGTNRIWILVRTERAGFSVFFAVCFLSQSKVCW